MRCSFVAVWSPLYDEIHGAFRVKKRLMIRTKSRFFLEKSQRSANGESLDSPQIPKVEQEWPRLQHFAADGRRA
jgi:hypothetical protein